MNESAFEGCVDSCCEPTGSVRNSASVQPSPTAGTKLCSQTSETAPIHCCRSYRRCVVRSHCGVCKDGARRRRKCAEWHADRWSDECRNFLKSRAVVASSKPFVRPCSFPVYTKSQLLLFAHCLAFVTGAKQLVFLPPRGRSILLWTRLFLPSRTLSLRLSCCAACLKLNLFFLSFFALLSPLQSDL